MRQAHLAGLFARVGAEEGIRGRSFEAVAAKIGPPLLARQVFNINLIAELTHIGALLAAQHPTVRPVLLKGAAYWDAYYDDPIARRVRDLDLFLEEPDDADALCDVLESEGYEALAFIADPRGVREQFRTGSSYSVPPLRIRRRANLEGWDRSSIERLIAEWGAETGLELDDGGPVITIDVELHRAPLTTVDGLVQSDPHDFQPSAAFPQFRTMTTGAALGYAGVKLSLDLLTELASDEPSLKCLKLAADFVRILSSSDQCDIETAMSLARRWGSLGDFADSLQALRGLVPEVAFRGLPDPGGDSSIDLMMGIAASRLGEMVLCSA